MRIGADSGGTFTDVVGTDGRVLKVPSTPADPGDAVRDGTAALAPDGPELLAHGTTVATNA
ncbi:MAG TPA: hydantoinase/oxoprolinase N-terminal domain-containing protein, partial [Microthrixaceae bacterium]|nr:hydantoinase/oxoprolinase N-terminal domain-containing protein [Microthrixaceae bacterium]